MEVLSVDNKIMTVNGKLAKAPSTTGTGDMKKSVYDPTGIVEAAGGIPDYVANNAPVVSVNGKTGDVKSTFYVTVTQDENNSVTVDKTPEEVYAAYTAGYAVYAIVSNYTYYPTIIPMLVGLTLSGEVLLSFGGLIGLKSFMAVQYNESAWSIITGTLANSDDIPTIPEYLPNPNALNIKIGDTTTSYDGSAAKTVEIPEDVPSVTTADNGKFLRVVNGAWAVAEVDNASGVSF